MIKLIAKINPRAGKEQLVLDKLNEVYDYPIITKIEQLSDFYTVLKFNEESVRKMALIKSCVGVLDIKLTPAIIVAENAIDFAETGEHYMVLVQTESGKCEQTMKSLLSNDKISIYHAAYFFDENADILLEIVTPNEPSSFVNLIRETEGVEDTILYKLPHIKGPN